MISNLHPILFEW